MKTEKCPTTIASFLTDETTLREISDGWSSGRYQFDRPEVWDIHCGLHKLLEGEDPAAAMTAMADMIKLLGGQDRETLIAVIGELMAGIADQD